MHHANVLGGTALILGLGLSGCLHEEDKEERKAPEAAGVDLLTYENGHPLLTDTDAAGQLAIEEELLRLTNVHRATLGLGPVLPHPVAAQSARAMSRHMRVHDFLAHVNPEGDGPGERLRRAGLEFEAAGENLAWGWDSAAQAFSFWISSPPHRANLEYPGWTHAGMGYWSGGATRTYYSQEFLRLR